MSEMPLVEHHVIEAFSSHRPDHALGEGILSGRSRSDEDLAHPQALEPPDEHVAVRIASRSQSRYSDAVSSGRLSTSW
jgi:hypothetical protein